MASTSTNKQPLLVDRVFSVTRDLSGKFIPPTVAIDLQAGSQGELLIDCTKNDGAVIECVVTLARKITQVSYANEADRQTDIDNGDTALQQTLGYVVNFYLCPSTTYLDPGSAFYIGGVTAGIKEGEQEIWWGMPYTHSPVARLGSTNQEPTGDQYDGLTPTMYQAQYVPKGMCLWAAVNQLILPPDSNGNAQNDDAARAPLLLAQGGYF